MKVNNLTKKESNIIFEVRSTCNEVGEVEGHYTTIEEAIKRAEDLKSELISDYVFDIYEMTWSEEEQEYIYQYDCNGGLLDPVVTI